jgi:cyclase
MVEHLRVLSPAEGVLAFYEGREEGHRFADAPNWVDDGALSLGVASYALVAGDAAVVYDTHVSVDRARDIRRALEARGVERFTVVLSHWHLDHVAGTEAFADCEIIASQRTAELLNRFRPQIESGTHHGPPAIDPLILPTSIFAGRRRLTLGTRELELIQVDIHSDDATVIWLPDEGLLLCGDTLEDTITYVAEPDGLDRHLAGLRSLSQLAPDRILPNHGDPDVIARGGYSAGLITATEDYIRTLQRCRIEPELQQTPLRELIADSLGAGSLRYFAPYEAVHQSNLRAVLAPR